MSEARTNSAFLPSELVEICLPSPTPGDSLMIFEGRVAAAGTRTLKISLINIGHTGLEALTRSPRCVIRKRTPRGMFEFDAVAEAHEANDSAAGKVTVTLTMAGEIRPIQRRDYCRFIVGTQARYREIGESADESWRTAELHDVSLGGASLWLPLQELRAGTHLLVEFSLDGERFSLPAIVRRVESKRAAAPRLCAVEYLDPDHHQRDRMSRAIAKLQQRIISSRIRIR